MSSPALDARPLELWAGVECTVNRVGDRWLDQLARNGHATRTDDVDRLAALGIRALRMPVLWERTCADAGREAIARADWAWSDAVLERVRAHGIRPIVTLLHHGSGPAGTSLLDPTFPERLAAYARAVAERYPWVEDWTPVNEPLTTARFAALYGLWYPHARDVPSFARALLHELQGTVLAMRAIREVIPTARLVQTEDLGKVHATPSLQYQAEFENERRWLTTDLLTGRLAEKGLAWRWLVRAGRVDAAALHAFAEDPCPPDVLGFNHYVTSERFLDRRLALYPEHTHGGNGRHRYADVEAVRVLGEGTEGPARLLCEAWERYGRPLAITEAHLGCTREQQIRWLVTVWRGAEQARAQGADVRAVTAWSALGAFDWDSLLTDDAGHYEPGLFDVRGHERGRPPRPTALAHVARDLATRGTSDHPALAGPGWWEMPQRLLYPAVRLRDGHLDMPRPECGVAAPAEAPPVLIVGARGTLGRALARACEERGLAHVALGRPALDASDPASVEAALAAHRPWAVINAAGYVRVDDAEREREACWRENVCAPVVLARACAARGIRLATYSSDLVFDGAADGRPYDEEDAPAPLNVYGASKADAEAQVLAIDPTALVLRTSAFFGPWDEWNFLTIALRELAAGREFHALADVHVSPTYVPHLTQATLDLLVDGERGLWHLANEGAVTWLEFARIGAARAGLDADGVRPQTLDAAALAAPRPRWSVLGSVRGRHLGPVENAICQYLAARAEPTTVARPQRPPRRAGSAPVHASP